MLLFPHNCVNEWTLQRELAQPGVNLVEGDPVAGYLLSRQTEELLDITRIGVLPEFQGQGIGRRLLEEAITRAPHQVMLTVSKSNRRALKLYHQQGFKIVGHNPAAWVMLLETIRGSVRG